MLENSYKIDPAFNKDLVLAYQPSPVMDASELPTPSKQWLNDLQKIICAANPRLLPNCLNKHLGASDYQAKNLLKEQLQIIYHRLQGNLDAKLGKLSPDNYQALLCKLTEEINNCSAGFHNRINIIVDSFQQPRNLDELLYIVRKRLVENVATHLSNEVHAWNRVSVVAATDGLGIKANLSNDIYSGNLAEPKIRQALQKKFTKYFTPFYLPNLLINAFKELIPELEIEKQSENGLCLQTQEKIKSLIKQFLPEFINENPKNSNDPNSWKNYFEIEADKKNLFIFKFTDINYEKLYQSFYYTLLNNNYFTTPKINTLLENAYYNLFLSNKDLHSPEIIISELFNEHQYYSLLAQLVELKTKYPIFYEENIVNPRNIKTTALFIKNCLVFNDFLTHQLAISEQYSKEITEGFLLILNLNLPRKEFLIEQIAHSLLVTNKANFNLLMLGALNNLELVKAIFAFLKKNESFISPEIAEKMLLMKNSDHCNALMIAVNKQRGAIITILGFLKNYIGRFANDTLYKLFTQQQKEDSNTALTLAARDNNDLLNTILGFFTDNLRIDGETFRKLLFPENSNGACTALMLAIKNQADSSLSILIFISKNIKSFDHEVLKRMFSEKDEKGFTLLMLAAQYHAEALTALIDLLERKLFSEEFLVSLFLEKNAQKYNFLMLAAEYQQPETLAAILGFIHKKRRIFYPYLNNLLFTKNHRGYNALMLSRHHPQGMMAIIKFISKQPKSSIPLSISEIFLIKNAAGLNLLMLLAKDSPESLSLIFEFIEKNFDRFNKENLLSLFQDKSLLGYNCLMLAARNQYHNTDALLNFILKKPKIFSSQFIDQYIASHDKNKANALMIAATYQPITVGLLLEFLTMNSAPKGPISIDTLKKVVFEKIHDKEAANAVFFGGRYNYYKSVLLVTSQFEDPTAVNALLKFIDHHIDLLGIEVFIDLLTEKDYQDDLIFGPACANYPGVLKKTLLLIANSATDEILIPVKELCAKFIFTQLARWPLPADRADQKLFDKVIEQCSAFLLTYFNKDFFAETSHNLKRVTDKLFACYLNELEDRKAKKIHYTTRFSFFKWRYSTAQKLEAALALQKVIENNHPDKEQTLSNLNYHYPAVGLCRLGKLFAAYQDIANLQEGYDAFELNMIQAVIPRCRTSYFI